MENAVKHVAWSGSLVACVYLATSNNWQPISLQIVAGTASGSAAIAAPNNSISGKNANPGNPLAGAQQPAPQVALAPANTPLAIAQAPLPTAAPILPQQAGSLSYATIENPDRARKVSEIMAKLASVVDAPAGTPEGKIATIFFDPRCPYCHKAFDALHGRIAARWVPVAVLGEPENGNRLAAGILTAADPVAALKATFEGKGGMSGEIGAETAAKLAENFEAFASIFAASPALRPGVPTMFVPRPDGRVAIMVGYEPGDDAKMRAVLAGS